MILVTLIYGLSDPLTGMLRYVGKTALSLDERLRRHLSEALRKRKTHRDYWIAGLLSKDIRPDVFLIEVVEGDAWVDAERFWIAYYRGIGCDLTNHTSGGEGESGWHLDEHARAKISAGNKGKPKSPEHVAKILAGPGVFKKGQVPHNAGKKASDETRKKIGDVQRGKPKGPPSEKHRESLRIAMAGKNAGVPWTQARRAAFASENRAWTSERRAAFSAKMTGRKREAKNASDA